MASWHQRQARFALRYQTHLTVVRHAHDAMFPRFPVLTFPVLRFQSPPPLERGADSHYVPADAIATITVSCFTKIQIGFTFLVG